MSEKGKALVNSKTFWAALVLVLANVAALFGVDISPADQNEIVLYVTAGISAIGGLLTMFFRYTAKKEITSVLPPAPPADKVD